MATIAKLDVLLGLNSAAFTKGLDKAQRTARRFGRDMQQVGGALTKSLTVPLVGVGVAATKLGLDFDQALSRIVGLVGVAEDQVAAWRGELLALGPILGKSPQELAEGLYYITSAGLRGSAAMDALKASAQASAAGLGETAVVADAVTSALNAYGQESMSAAKATAILVAAVREGKAGADTIAPAIGRVLPVASELGVSFDQVAASIAAMTRLGLDSAESVTALRATLTTLLKPTKQAEDALAEMDLSIGGLRDTLRDRGLLAMLQQLGDGLKKTSVDVSDVFGNVRALTGVLNLTGASAGAAEAIFASLAATTEHDLTRAFQVAEEQGAHRLAVAFATVQAALIRLSDSIVPLIMPAVEAFRSGVGRLMDAFDKLPASTKAVIVGIAALAAAIGPVLVVVGLAATVIGTLTASTLGWVAGVAAAATVVATKWDAIRGTLDGFITWVRPAFSGLGEFFVELWQQIGQWAAEVWPTVQELATKAADTIAKFWERHGATITAVTRAAWGFVKSYVVGALDVILGYLKVVLEVVNGDWSGAMDTIRTTTLKVWDGVGRYFRAGAAVVVAALNGLAASAGEAITSALERLRALAAAWAAMPWATPGRMQAAEALGHIDAAIGTIGASTAKLRGEQEAWNKRAEELLAPLTKAATAAREMSSQWYTLADFQTKATESAVAGSMTLTRAFESSAESLKGGFGTAIDEVFTGAAEKWESWAVKVEARPLRITLDQDYLRRQFNDAIGGPDTAGALP